MTLLVQIYSLCFFKHSGEQSCNTSQPLIYVIVERDTLCFVVNTVRYSSTSNCKELKDNCGRQELIQFKIREHNVIFKKI